MKQQAEMGRNRTGAHMSPTDTTNMQSAQPTTTTPVTTGDETAIADARSRDVEQDNDLGAAHATGTVPQLLLDKLGERLAFERTGTRLYDALITKFNATQDDSTSMTLADLQKIRDDEARHVRMMESAIETIGGDPTAQTPCADVVGIESQGLMQVLTDPRTTIAQSLHAILVAEMTDNVGWEQLIVLAEDQRQMSLISDFSVALDEERAHLLQVRQWYEEATLGRSISDGALIDDVSDMNTSTPLH